MATTSNTGSTKPSMGATEEFFDALAKRRHEPLLHSASGTVRFDLVDGGSVEHWSVAIARGNVSVSRRATKADALVRLDRALFDRIVTGRENAMAAALRGVLVPKGDLGLVMLFQRLFSGPPNARGGAKAATGRVPR
jgi:putative sterol carrier protein